METTISKLVLVLKTPRRVMWRLAKAKLWQKLRASVLQTPRPLPGGKSHMVRQRQQLTRIAWLQADQCHSFFSDLFKTRI